MVILIPNLLKGPMLAYLGDPILIWIKVYFLWIKRFEDWWETC